MLKPLKGVVKFSMAFFVMTIVCTISWEVFVNGRLYNCTDQAFFDYLKPGDWVHAWGDHPIAVVAHVTRDGDMNHPDTIKEGWTVTRIWYLWFVFLGTSLAISAILARLPWPRLGLLSAKRSAAE
jgi:hypothetical protein